MINFTIAKVNRPVFPDKYILIVEDDLLQQLRLAQHFHEIFYSQGNVRVNFVSSAIDAACLISSTAPKPDVIILDHDLQYGTGSELIEFMKERSITIPIITASGLPGNNAKMAQIGVYAICSKEDVISGRTDFLIEDILAINMKIK
ncbi:hypothetical protein LCGC14_0646900 [marine sediment metagenome]|uniref:Response regulatory domain-containing protein n=1 Tax=marine sediment metagenome TaxID=412755 RepID=A0A0F9U5W4_9ZZZZ